MTANIGEKEQIVLKQAVQIQQLYAQLQVEKDKIIKEQAEEIGRLRAEIAAKDDQIKALFPLVKNLTEYVRILKHKGVIQ